MKENRLAPSVPTMLESSESPIERAVKHLERTSRCWPMVLSDTIIFNMASVSFMHLSIFSFRGWGGGDTLGIRQQNNSNALGLDRTPKDMGWVIRYFSRSSKLNLMAHPRDFGLKVFANGWGISQRFFKIV